MTIDNEKNSKEELNRDELFKLYEIALEEARHYSRTSLQLWVAMPLVLTVIGTLAFSSKEALLSVLHSAGSWVLVSSVGSLVSAFVFCGISVFDEAADICRNVATEIENMLTRQDSGDISRLFVTGRVREVLPVAPLGLGDWWQIFKLLWQRGDIIALLLVLVLWWCLWWWVFH